MVSDTPAWIQAGAAVAALLVTAVLARLAYQSFKATETMSVAATAQAAAGTRQADASSEQVREATTARLLTFMPLVSVRAIRADFQPPRSFLELELVCESTAPAIGVKASVRLLSDRNSPIPDSQPFVAAEVPILGPGRTHPVSDVSSASRADRWHVGYPWMSVEINCRGILGAQTTTVLEFAPNDALDKPPGSPGYGQRFEFRSLNVDLDKTGRHRLEVGEAAQDKTSSAVPARPEQG